MIMCHPGFADDELGTADAIAHRRPEEYAVLSRRVDIPDMIWRANRTRCEIGCQWPVNDGDAERQR